MSTKTKAKKAFELLKKKGVPVYSSENYGDRGYFWISGEDGKEEWLDYYNNFFGSDELNEILMEHDLFFEWHNPGYACVYDA